MRTSCQRFATIAIYSLFTTDSHAHNVLNKRIKYQYDPHRDLTLRIHLHVLSGVSRKHLPICLTNYQIPFLNKGTGGESEGMQQHKIIKKEGKKVYQGKETMKMFAIFAIFKWYTSDSCLLSIAAGTSLLRFQLHV